MKRRRCSRPTAWPALAGTGLPAQAGLLAGAGVLAVTFIVAAPAAAHDAGAPPGVSALARRSDDGYLAQDFETRGCDGITGGARPGIDGWVFQRPVTGALDKVYGFLFAENQDQVLEVRIDASGVHGVDVSDTKSLVDDVQKVPISGTAGATGANIVLAPLPPGVAGGLIPDAGAWLQTPAGWRLVDGALDHGNVYDSPAEFDLLQVCVVGPAPSTDPAAAPSDDIVVIPEQHDPSAAGPARHRSGLRTGSIVAGWMGGIGILAAGVATFVVRRRRRRQPAHFLD